MKRKWIVRLIAFLVAATGIYALSSSTARSDKAILCAEFGVPLSAKVVHYKASPKTGVIPLPREGLDIEVVFLFGPREYHDYVRRAEEDRLLTRRYRYTVNRETFPNDAVNRSGEAGQFSIGQSILAARLRLT